MKIAHRKTLWIHTLFSVVACVLLGIILLTRRDISTIALVTVIAVYVLANALIHLMRDDFRQDTLVEYVLVGVAIVVVLAGALL